ncbi:MAG: hypothetical protein JWL75_532 [Parcubacteria group bacterium]|nr:hypothetical protein [Parcubacteria group bacterium]
MASKQINPFLAILAITIIGATGTFFVVHKIFDTDFTYASAAAHDGISTN